MLVDLTPSEIDDLAALLDEIIPPSPDGGMPGAGELGLASRIVGELAVQQGALEQLRNGLESLRREAGEEGFAQSPRARRKEIVAAVDARDPALVAGLLFPTWVAYYEHPRALAGLGLKSTPPHPGGYALEPFDESLLEPVRARSPFYRKC
jgi:hypothetical protein